MTTNSKTYAYCIKYKNRENENFKFDIVIYSNRGILFTETTIDIQDSFAENKPIYLTPISDIDTVTIIDVSDKKFSKDEDLFRFALQMPNREIVCLTQKDLIIISNMYSDQFVHLYKEKVKDQFICCVIYTTDNIKNRSEKLTNYAYFRADSMLYVNGEKVRFSKNGDEVFEIDLDNLIEVYSLKYTTDKRLYFNEFKNEYKIKTDESSKESKSNQEEKLEVKAEEANEGKNKKEEENTFKGKNDLISVEWLDSYSESFEAKKWRLGSDTLWIKLSDNNDRHIPLRSVRYVIQRLKITPPKNMPVKRIGIRWHDGDGRVFECFKVQSGSDTLCLYFAGFRLLFPLRSVRWWGICDKDELPV